MITVKEVKEYNADTKYFVKGVLLLVETKSQATVGDLCIISEGPFEGQYQYKNTESMIWKGKKVNPVIISETEIPEYGELCFCLDELEYGYGDCIVNKGNCNGCRKVLAWPDNFSVDQISLIAEGKIKAGNIILECEKLYQRTGDNDSVEINPFIIKLVDSHIVIKPSLKDYIQNLKTNSFEEWNQDQINTYMTAITSIEKWIEEFEN